MPEFTRLPKHFQPTHYDLTVHPNLKNFSNFGKLKINLKIDSSKITNNIIRIHSSEIVIESAVFNGESSKNITYDVENEEAHLEFFESGVEFSHAVKDGNENLLEISYIDLGGFVWWSSISFSIMVRYSGLESNLYRMGVCFIIMARVVRAIWENCLATFTYSDFHI